MRFNISWCLLISTPASSRAEDATVTCQRFANPLTGVHCGCGGRGVVDGAVRTLCLLCGGVGRLFSARGLKDELARFSVLFGERLPDATDEAIEEHNKRQAAADQAAAGAQ